MLIIVNVNSQNKLKTWFWFMAALKWKSQDYNDRAI